MDKQTKMLVGGAALAAVAVGGIYLATRPAAAAVPAGPTPATPTYTAVTTFTAGSNYGFAAQLPAGVADVATLMAQLTTAGWTNVTILYFGPTAAAATIPAGLPFSLPGPVTSAYVASGTWSGATGTPVPAGVSAALIS